jgi:hypothetical protein
VSGFAREWRCPHCGAEGVTTAYVELTETMMVCMRCKKRFSLETVLRAEPIIGWRVWRLIPQRVAFDVDEVRRLFLAGDALAAQRTILGLPDDGAPWRLGSIAGPSSSWGDGTIPAACIYQQHAAPNLDCHCGFWAMEREDQLADVIASYCRGSSFAFGQVQLWGRYVRHRLGWRAQFARPYDITVVNGTEDMLRSLRDFYATDVRRVDELPEHLAVGVPHGLGRFITVQLTADATSLAGAFAALQKSVQNTAKTISRLMALSTAGQYTPLAPPPRRNRAHGRPRGRAPRTRRSAPLRWSA